jgi:putative ABC transport system permease protein
VAEGPGLNAALTREIPAPGTVWVEAALLDALGLEMGQPLLLGDASLRVSKIIVSEPDRGGGFISFSPRVMLNQADVAATGLIQPSSRSTYRLAVAGEDRAVKAYIAWTTQVLDKNDVRGLRIESLDSGRPEMRQTLDRAEKFLNLVSLLAALLSAVAVAIVSRGFAAKHLDDCAMLRVLGQPQRKIIISRHNAYHGSTMAGASLGGMSGMHAQGDLPIPNICHIQQPYHFENALPGESEADFGIRAAGWLEQRIWNSGRRKSPPSSASRCRARAA